MRTSKAIKKLQKKYVPSIFKALCKKYRGVVEYWARRYPLSWDYEPATLIWEAIPDYDEKRGAFSSMLHNLCRKYATSSYRDWRKVARGDEGQFQLLPYKGGVDDSENIDLIIDEVYRRLPKVPGAIFLELVRPSPEVLHLAENDKLYGGISEKGGIRLRRCHIAKYLQYSLKYVNGLVTNTIVPTVKEVCREVENGELAGSLSDSVSLAETRKPFERNEPMAPKAKKSKSKKEKEEVEDEDEEEEEDEEEIDDDELDLDDEDEEEDDDEDEEEDEEDEEDEEEEKVSKKKGKKKAAKAKKARKKATKVDRIEGTIIPTVHEGLMDKIEAIKGVEVKHKKSITTVLVDGQIAASFPGNAQTGKAAKLFVNKIKADSEEAKELEADAGDKLTFSEWPEGALKIDVPAKGATGDAVKVIKSIVSMVKARKAESGKKSKKAAAKKEKKGKKGKKAKKGKKGKKSKK